MNSWFIVISPTSPLCNIDVVVCVSGGRGVMCVLLTSKPQNSAWYMVPTQWALSEGMNEWIAIMHWGIGIISVHDISITAAVIKKKCYCYNEKPSSVKESSP